MRSSTFSIVVALNKKASDADASEAFVSYCRGAIKSDLADLSPGRLESVLHPRQPYSQYLQM